MRTLLMAVLAWVVAGTAVGQPPAPGSSPLTLKVAIEKGSVTAYVKNLGDGPVMVITSQLALSFDALDKDKLTPAFRKYEGVELAQVSKRPFAILAYTLQERHEGALVIPDPSSLKLVTLQKGEQARLDLPSKYIEGVLKRAVLLYQDVAVNTGREPEQHVFTLRYEVSEFWGKRFHAWHGAVQAECKVPTWRE